MAVVEEFDYLCRLCATKTGILMGLPIFEAGDQMRNIDKKIAACLPVQRKKISARLHDLLMTKSKLCINLKSYATALKKTEDCDGIQHIH
ncbi:hypothetical protein E2986_11995 [Frieseomelitta varia]|uniref:Uncharacterized protein n=1 Tax=Frieseomelitta varia TaxID=561572 RepID=A0A833W678_9HYME|nr:hypothetical protein E2986_11995 [Frieseomelitta varia]